MYTCAEVLLALVPPGATPAFIMQQAAAQEMTPGGWVFMLGAWAGILSLAAFCFSKVLRNRKK